METEPAASRSDGTVLFNERIVTVMIRISSHVNLPEVTRNNVVDRLNAHLANTLDLHSQVKQAHWTLKGPQFFARHELFDKVAAHLSAQADDVAERVSTLGGYPQGTLRMAAKRSAITEFDTGHMSGASLIRDLVSRFAMHSSMMREQLGFIESDDPVSADLLMGQLRQVELDLWFFESHFNE